MLRPIPRCLIAAALPLLGSACLDSPTAPDESRELSVELPASLMPKSNPCTGAPLSAHAGVTRFRFHEIIDLGGGFHFQIHSLHQTVGTDASGAEFRSFERIHENFMSRQPLPIVRTRIYNLNVISAGSAPNFRLHVTFHIVINKNSSSAFEPSVEVADISSSCA